MCYNCTHNCTIFSSHCIPFPGQLVLLLEASDAHTFLLRTCSNLNTTLNISPPSLLASQRFLSTATLRASHEKRASKFVCMARPMPSITTRSVPCFTMVWTRSLSVNLPVGENTLKLLILSKIADTKFYQIIP